MRAILSLKGLMVAVLVVCVSMRGGASELIGNNRDDWWGDLFIGAVVDSAINPVADANGKHREAVAFFQLLFLNQVYVYRLFLSSFDGSNWQTEAVLDLPENLYAGIPETAVATCISLTFRDDGSPGIAFGWQTNSIVGSDILRAFHAHFVQKIGSTWQFNVGTMNTILELPPTATNCDEESNNFGVHDIDLAFTPANVPCIVLRTAFATGSNPENCSATHAVKYSENRSAAADMNSSSTIGFGHAAIAMNPVQGTDLLKPAVAFDAPANPGVWRFRTKTASGNNWTAADTVTGQGVDLAFLPNGTPVASFTTGTGGNAFYGKRIGGSWQTTSIAANPAGMGTAITISPFNNSNPSILLGTNEVFTYRASSNSWIRMGDVLGTDSSNSYTSYATMALDSDPKTGVPFALVEDEVVAKAFLAQPKRLEVQIASDEPGTVLNLTNTYAFLFDSSGNIVPFVQRFSGNFLSAAKYAYTTIKPGTYTLYVDAVNHALQSRVLTFDTATMLKEVFVLEYCPESCW